MRLLTDRFLGIHLNMIYLILWPSERMSKRLQVVFFLIYIFHCVLIYYGIIFPMLCSSDISFRLYIYIYIYYIYIYIIHIYIVQVIATYFCIFIKYKKQKELVKRYKGACKPCHHVSQHVATVCYTIFFLAKSN